MFPPWRVMAHRLARAARSRVGRLGTFAATRGRLRGGLRDSVELPPAFARLSLTAFDGRRFVLVRAEPPTAYEQGFIDGADWGTRDVVWLLRRCLGATGLLVDVGANIGAVSFAVAAAGTPVIAVEMLPSNCLKLQLAIPFNGMASVRLFQAGASSADGLLTFGGHDAWGAVGQGQQTAVALTLATIVTLARAEDGSLADRPLVLKIDVEGHELEVLRGAAELIRRERPLILFESIDIANGGSEQVAKQCKRLLKDQGYDLYLQRGHILVPREPDDFQETLVVDFLAVPSERAEVLAGIEVRPLSSAERAAWISELTRGPDDLHQWHAANATAAFLREDPAHRELAAPLLAALLESSNASISELARATLDASTPSSRPAAGA